MDVDDRIEADGTGVIRKSGFDFGFDPAACAACGARCCRGKSGNIWVNAEEIKDISRFLGTHPIDFMRTSIHRVDNRLSIRERYTEDGFSCAFLENGPQARCGIYPVRPQQCRTFPFWECYRGGGRPPVEECPGVR